MLPPFIIDQIRKREERAKRREQENVLELPLPLPNEGRHKAPETEAPRGVVVIDL